MRRQLRRLWGAALRRPPRRTRDFTYTAVVLQEKVRRLRTVAEHTRTHERNGWAQAEQMERKADELILAMRALQALERAGSGVLAAGAAS